MTSGILEIEGARIAYEDEGGGPAVLLIHGGLGDRRMWDAQSQAFAGRYRVIRYDTRGWGQTQTDDVEYVDAADAVAVLDHVGVDAAHVVGQSRGGSIALDLVLAYPDRARSLLSVAGGIHGFEAPRPPESSPAPFEEMERLWEAKDWEALAELETRVWVDGWGQPTTRVDPELRARVREWILGGYRAETPWGKPQALEPPAAARLGEVDVPTLVMIGDVDEAGGVAAGHHLAASVRGARSVVFPGVAHMIHLEEPDRFNDLALQFYADAEAAATAS